MLSNIKAIGKLENVNATVKTFNTLHGTTLLGLIIYLKCIFLKPAFLPKPSISVDTVCSRLQLEHARLTQTELMRESFRHNQEMNELLQKQEELQERLTEEARAREQLALELHRAEGEFLSCVCVC